MGLERLSVTDVQYTTNVYKYLAENSSDDGWPIDIKRSNFERLTKGLAEYSGFPLSGSSVFDVGCGTGDLLPYCEKVGVTNYLGVDINLPSLKIAKHKYPQGNFVRADILNGGINSTFDFSIASGTFSINQKGSDNYTFLQSMIRSMWKMTSKGLAFNVLTVDTEYSDQKSEFVHLYDAERVKRICQEIDEKALILLKDAPMWNGEFVESQINVFMIPGILS